MLPKPLMKRLARFGIDGFLLSLLCSVALAWILPDLGRSGGLLHIDLFTTYGVGFIFLLYGLTLAPDKVRAGLANWKLHIMVQGATFLLFPLVAGLVLKAAGPILAQPMRVGLFHLASLPSTVSSSVAMTSLAKGNVPSAIFNASLSTLFGVAITPFWMDWYLSQSATPLDLGGVFFKITVLVALPIIMGQVLRPLIFNRVAPYMGIIKLMDRGTILAMVFNSFADSVTDGIWAEHGLDVLGIVIAVSLLLILGVSALLFAICRYLGFDRGDTIAAVFCGTKKSLISGVPMADVMFAGSPILGIVLLPIMIYHFQQLVLASLVARWLGEGGTITTPVLLQGLGRALRSNAARGAVAVAMTFAGALLAAGFDWPVPLILGPAVACALAGMFGLPSRPPAMLAAGASAAIGLLLGGLAGRLNGGAIETIPDMLVFSLALAVAGATVLTPVIRRVSRLDMFDAWLSALPAPAEEHPAIASEAIERAGEMRVWHALRSAGVLVAIPAVVMLTGWGNLPPSGPALDWTGLGGLLILLPSVIGLQFVARGLHWPAPWLCAGFISGLAGVLAFDIGIVPAAPLVGVFGQIFAGAVIGGRLAGVSLSTLASVSPRAVGVAFLHLDVTLLAALAATALFDADFPVLLLLCAPIGALETAALALALHVPDPGLITAVALLRALAIGIAVPAMYAMRTMAAPRLPKPELTEAVANPPALPGPV